MTKFLMGAPAIHIGGILWTQSILNGWSKGFIEGLMKISTFEIGYDDSGEPASTNKCYYLDKNAFGMLLPSVRKTTAIGSRSTNDGVNNVKYAVYSSYWSSVKDVILWLEYNNAPASLYKTTEPMDVIVFAENKSWNSNMIPNHGAVSTDKVDTFINKGKMRVIIMTLVMTSLTIFTLSRIFKGSTKTKFMKAIGPLKLFASKSATRVRRTTTRGRVAVRRTMRRAKTTMSKTPRRYFRRRTSK